MISLKQQIAYDMAGALTRDIHADLKRLVLEDRGQGYKDADD